MLKTLALSASLLFSLALAPAAARAQQQPQADGHEYAPLREQAINYKDWTFRDARTGEAVNLRRWAEGKRLVMVVYFAAWCRNWRFEAPVVARLYEKYRAHGFDVIAVSEYASTADARAFFGEQGAPYKVVVESEGREERERTTHYAYRKACGDARRYGSPFNVFLEPARMAARGEVVAEKAWVVGGELIEHEAEQFIRERLGLSEKARMIEPCRDEP